MANLIIKPSSGNSLVFQDEGGDAALTIGTTGTITAAGTTSGFGAAGITSSAAGTAITIDSSNNTTLAGTANALGTVTSGNISNAAIVFPVGFVLKVSYYAIGRAAITAADWPNDDTVPQRTEGTEIFSQAYTPSISGCDLLITANAKLGETGNSRNDMALGLFISDNNDALQVQDVYVSGGDLDRNSGTCMLAYKMASWGTTEKTFSLRAHAANAYNYSNAGNAYATAKYGAAAYKSAMIITEIKT